MNQKELSELTDQESMDESKKTKPSFIINAFFIGFLVGILIYSLVANSWGFFTLIPLIMVYRLLRKPKRHEAIIK